MAGSRIFAANNLLNFANYIKSPLLSEVQAYARPLILFDQRRYTRRTKTVPKWLMRRWPAVSSKGELTPENQDFIKKLVVNQYQNIESPLKDGPWERGTWTPRTSRCGLLGIKIGSQPLWFKNGKKVMCTLIQVVDNHVIRYTPPDDLPKNAPYSVVHPAWHGRYGFQVVGALSTDPNMFSKEYNNLFKDAGVPPKRKLCRFLVTPDAAAQPGTPLSVNHFRVGDYVDVEGRTVDHGFQGVVKRWNFKGGPASHGNTKWHRRPGSISGGDSSRVHKGKKMPGHMGEERRSLRGLKVLRINTKENVLYVVGQNTPGPIHGYVKVIDTYLNHRKMLQEDNPPPMPTWYSEDVNEPLPDELYDETIFQFTDDSLELQEKSN